MSHVIPERGKERKGFLQHNKYKRVSQGWPPRTPLCDWPPLGQEIEEERRERKGVISLAKLPTGLMRETNQLVRGPHQEANITEHLLD